jgi:hypothetical protein
LDVEFDDEDEEEEVEVVAGGLVVGVAVVLAPEVAEIALEAVLAAMFAPSARNAQTLNAPATIRERAAAWRFRTGPLVCGDRCSIPASVHGQHYEYGRA